MKIITRKSDVEKEIKACFQTFEKSGLDSFTEDVHEQLLQKKVKFPLLEYCALRIYEEISEENHIEFCDRIEVLKTEGGNVILGIVLQNRMSHHFHESIEKAVEYISKADEWYVPDIMGERVFGWALLHHPRKTLKVYRGLINHKNEWVVRSLGSGVHNAVKNGLEKPFVKEVLPILLRQSGTRDYQIKRGIGWAAKTIARFHPDVIEQFRSEIFDDEHTGRWFQSKVETGLKRNRHA